MWPTSAALRRRRAGWPVRRTQASPEASHESQVKRQLCFGSELSSYSPAARTLPSKYWLPDIVVNQPALLTPLGVPSRIGPTSFAAVIGLAPAALIAETRDRMIAPTSAATVVYSGWSPTRRHGASAGGQRHHS